MASKNFTGYLRSSLGDYADHDIWRFTHISTTGEVVAGSAAQFKVDSSGFYDIDVEYGNVVIESKNSLTRRWFNHGVTTINSDTSVTTLPALLNALVPASNSVILQMQSLLSDAESAKNDALQAKSDTESLFNNFDSSVADSVSRVGAFEPDVYIPFNDSLEIVRGYGTHDQIDVSAAQDGSVMVDLPSKSVDFSRASGRTVINKSGELVTLGVDEAAINSDGLGVCGEYTNKLYWSEDVTNAAWLKTVGASVVNDGEKGSNGVTPMYLCSVDNTKQDPRISQIGAIQTQGSSAVFSVVVKKATSDTVALLIASITGGIMVAQPLSFNFATEQFESISPQLDFTKVVKLANGCYQLFMGITDNSSGNTTWRMDVIRKGGATGISDVYASQAMIVEGVSFPVPYVKTESTPVTSSPDVASIPMRNNMPAAGKSFTFIDDVYVTTKGATRTVKRSGGSASNSVGCWVDTNNRLTFITSDGSNFVTSISDEMNEGIHRVGCRYDEDTKLLSTFVDGNKSGIDSTNNNVTYSLSGGMSIGSGFGGSFPLNSELKNFRIIHRALSDDEIKALGAAK